MTDKLSIAESQTILGGSEVFRGIINAARKQLLIDHEKSSAFENTGIIGDERAAAFAEFLRQRLPDYLDVRKGEVIDCFDKRTGQLDIVIYDKLAARPISEQRENVLVPCESLYAVVEVKSLLNKEEIRKSLLHSAKVRKLSPYKNSFVSARRRGAPIPKDTHRCFYLVFAYASDLSAEDWMKKEYARLTSVSDQLQCDPSTIDRVFVVDRGIISPIRGQGRVVDSGPEYLFAELFIHLVDFIERERSRRPPIRWDFYALPKRGRWQRAR